jgi:hypothetical protein
MYHIRCDEGTWTFAFTRRGALGVLSTAGPNASVWTIFGRYVTGRRNDTAGTPGPTREALLREQAAIKAQRQELTCREIEIMRELQRMGHAPAVVEPCHAIEAQRTFSARHPELAAELRRPEFSAAAASMPRVRHAGLAALALDRQ